MGEIVPLFTIVGSSAGILHEVQKHKHEKPGVELPFGQLMKGGLLGAAIGTVADIVVQTATRRRAARGGSGRAGHPPRRSGRTGGDGLAAAGIQGSPSGLMSSRRSSERLRCKSASAAFAERMLPSWTNDIRCSRPRKLLDELARGAAGEASIALGEGLARPCGVGLPRPPSAPPSCRAARS